MSINYILIVLLAVIGGIFLALQGGLNSNLGQHLKSPIQASFFASLTSTIFSFILVISTSKQFPVQIKYMSVPTHLWFAGGLFSVIGISLYYFTIPKLGISTMISLGLMGQLLFSAIAGHYGWLNLPVEPFTFKRFTGLTIMVIGILILLQSKESI